MSAFASMTPIDVPVSDHYDGLTLWYPDKKRGFFLASTRVQKLELVEDHVSALLECSMRDPQSDESVSVVFSIDEPLDLLMKETPTAETIERAKKRIEDARQR